MTRNKVFLYILISFLLIGTIGCDSSKSGNTPSQPQISPQSGSMALPIVKSPITVRWFSTNYANTIVSSYAEIDALQELEKRTGIKIEWIHPLSNDQLNLMLASADYPDIISGGDPVKTYNDKITINLKDLIDQHAPSLKKVLSSNPDMKRQAVNDSGDIISFPQLNPDLRRNAYRGFMMRKDWLTKVNMTAPTTVDEWYKVLKAFKDKDPNGNGKADEIPYCDEKGGGIGPMAAAWGVKGDFFVSPKTGKMTYGPIEPAYKEYLSTMRKWYEEGLIDKEYAKTDRKGLDSKVYGDFLGTFWGTTGSYMSTYLLGMKDNNPQFDLIGIQFPIGPAGKAYNAVDGTNNYASTCASVSTASKYPVEITKMMNYMYSDEGTVLFNWGIKGKSYTEENGQKKFTDAVLKNPDGKLPTDMINKFSLGGVGFTRAMDYEAYKVVYYGMPQQQAASELWFKSDMSLLKIPVTLTPDEKTQYDTIMSDVNSYKNQMNTKFITGVESMDRFDDYVQTIKKMRIDDATQIQQAAYERYMNRK